MAGLVNDAPSGGAREVRARLCAAASVEPESRRITLHALACDEPAAAGSHIARSLEAELWPAWRPVLEALGASPRDLGRVIEGSARETWLWVMGERTWAHTVEGLAGRVARRLGRFEPEGSEAATTTGGREVRRATGPGSSAPGRRR